MHWCPQEMTLFLSACLCLGCAKDVMRWTLSRLSERVLSRVRMPWRTLAEGVTRQADPSGRKESS